LSFPPLPPFGFGSFVLLNPLFPLCPLTLLISGPSDIPGDDLYPLRTADPPPRLLLIEYVSFFIYGRLYSPRTPSSFAPLCEDSKALCNFGCPLGVRVPVVSGTLLLDIFPLFLLYFLKLSLLAFLCWLFSNRSPGLTQIPSAFHSPPSPSQVTKTKFTPQCLSSVQPPHDKLPIDTIPKFGYCEKIQFYPSCCHEKCVACVIPLLPFIRKPSKEFLHVRLIQ